MLNLMENRGCGGCRLSRGDYSDMEMVLFAIGKSLSLRNSDDSTNKGR